jgi:hypothetical protein
LARPAGPEISSHRRLLLPGRTPVTSGAITIRGLTHIDARGHAEAIQFDFMHPLRSRWRLLDGLRELRRDELWEGGVGSAAARWARLDGL